MEWIGELNSVHQRRDLEGFWTYRLSLHCGGSFVRIEQFDQMVSPLDIRKALFCGNFINFPIQSCEFLAYASFNFLLLSSVFLCYHLRKKGASSLWGWCKCNFIAQKMFSYCVEMSIFSGVCQSLRDISLGFHNCMYCCVLLILWRSLKTIDALGQKQSYSQGQLMRFQWIVEWLCLKASCDKSEPMILQ